MNFTGSLDYLQFEQHSMPNSNIVDSWRSDLDN